MMEGIFREQEPLAPHTSWHIGGNAERYYCPANLEDLAQYLKNLSKDEPLTWLGLGSNVLIADEGIKGTVIHTLGMLPGTPEIQENGLVRALASIPCAKLAKFCAKNNLVGGAFFAGIPGTIGGALTMNAGAFGGETWRFVDSVLVMNRQGEILERYPTDYQINYRKVHAHVENQEWFVAAYFRFNAGDGNEAAAEIKQLLKKRSETQPIGVFSCGSVFKNPPGNYAARLIESCGLKGFEIGTAMISPKHANFIINPGHAKAVHVLELIRYIKEQVFLKHQICLETEVRFLGFENGVIP